MEGCMSRSALTDGEEYWVNAGTGREDGKNG